MPIINGRLTCCCCGFDLGDAEDPYRDPDCPRCLEEELERDWEEEQQITMRDGSPGYEHAAGYHD